MELFLFCICCGNRAEVMWFCSFPAVFACLFLPASVEHPAVSIVWTRVALGLTDKMLFVQADIKSNEQLPLYWCNDEHW